MYWYMYVAPHSDTDIHSPWQLFSGTSLPSGDLGPVYGFQWRHFGAEYVDMHTDYTDQGVDQLARVIHTIRTDPDCRRIIMSAWNPPGECGRSIWQSVVVRLKL